MSEQDTSFERILIALPISAPTSSDLSLINEDLPQFKWAHESHLHLTLRFVGEVDTALREAIAKSLDSIEVEPFILSVENIGVFPPKGQPQTIYAGVGTGHPRLFQLQHRVEEALASLGLPLELRSFTPHITVARTSRAKAQAVHEFVKRHKDFAAAPFKVEKFCLYKTTLTHFGSQYTILEEFPLRMKQAKVG